MQRAAAGVLLLVPGALVAGLSFSAGGFFPGPPALAAVVLALLLVGRVTLAADPFAGIGRASLAGAVLLALLAGWMLVSASWSDAPARALVEYDRALLYALAFLLLATLARTTGRVRWLVRGLVLAIAAVAVCAFVTRAMPDVWPTSTGLVAERLGYPLTYWNALGILTAVGVVLAFAIAADAREPAVGRVLAAAALPVLGATLLFTFSRGAMAACAAGLLAAVVLGRSPALLAAVAAAVPAAFAVRAAYGADLLATPEPASAAAVAQGHDLAVVVAACTVAAALLRALFVPVDRRLARVAVPARLRHPAVGIGAAVVLLAAVAGAGLALGAPGAIERQYDRFLTGGVVRDEGDARDRLTQVGNNGRLDQWRVAIDESRAERLKGTGAGTYALLWERGRPHPIQVEDAHSLYIEMLAELGAVGLLLVAAALLLILGGFAWRSRGPDRGVHAALAGAGVAWALHAGIDWDWEMPATGIWLFAAGGLVLARPAGAATRGLSRPARVVAGLALLLVAVTPARVYLSEVPLQDAREARAAGNCERAIDRSLDSLAALGERPEPWAIVGYCDVRLGYGDLAVRALERAVERDPGNWEFHYGLALVRGAAGMDPRPAARRAHELNPRSALAQEAVRRFSVDDPRAWRRRAAAARLPTDG